MIQHYKKCCLDHVGFMHTQCMLCLGLEISIAYEKSQNHFSLELTLPHVEEEKKRWSLDQHE
jgi:hypothetical protein